MYSLITGIASLIIPGLGQAMHGEFLVGFVWFVIAVIAGPIINIFSAIHAMTMGGKKCRC